MGQSIENGVVGIFHYTLTGEDGETIESSRGGEPMAYLHGHGGMIPGVEKALEGKSAGDAFQVTVSPADGYGEHDGVKAQRVHRREFPKNFDFQVGRGFGVEDSSGQQKVLYITKVSGAWVWIDGNHPMAGKTLGFDIEVVGVRPATSEEVQHGHAHGVHGHAHHH